MAIYSREIQTLTDQLVAQAADLQSAVANSDGPGIANAADAIAQTASNLDNLIKASDIPAGDTMILYLSTQLLGQVGDLQAAITANDEPRITASASDVGTTTNNFDACVTKMAEMQVVEQPMLSSETSP